MSEVNKPNLDELVARAATLKLEGVGAQAPVKRSISAASLAYAKRLSQTSVYRDLLLQGRWGNGI